MDRTTIWRALALAIPTAILGLLPLAFPELTLWLLGGLAVLWIAVVFLLLLERILSLQKQLREKGTSETSESTWTKLDEIKLFLERAQATRTFPLSLGDTIRVSVSGKKRFKVYLAMRLPRGKFERIKGIPVTNDWRGTWDIESDGEYEMVVEPVGASPFWVDVVVEKERKAGAIVSDW